MKKVKMILTNRFDPDVRVYKEARYLVSIGYDVEILCWDRQSEYIGKEVEEIEGIRIKRFFPFAQYGTGYKQIIPYFKFIRECAKYLKAEEFNYLHCHDLDGVLVGYFIKNAKGKLIFDMHEFYEVQGSKQKIRYIVRIIVNYLQDKSDFIIYVNEIQRDVMKKINTKKLIFLPNYPEIFNYAECEKTFSKNLRVSYIGAVRQYDELKNLMDACDGIEGVSVSIHGTGVAHKRLDSIKNNYKNVEITGVFHFSKSANLYNNIDVLYAIYPMNTVQNQLSFPIKFFEALITKTPIIVSRGSILEDFLKENDIGFVVDGNNTNEIRTMIIEINNNRNLLNEKMKNLEKIQYDYNWNNVVGNLDKIYK